MQGLPFVDVHNHCQEFSPDSGQPLSERIAEAKALGLAGIVMTDHYDKDLVDQEVLPGLSPMGSRPKPGEWIFYFPDYYERYKVEKAALAEKRDPFKLLLGVELGYAPALAEPYRELMSNYPMDSIIASLHNLEFRDVYWFKELYQREKIEVYRLYLNGLRTMLEDMDFANILGHFDYISRYAHYDHKKMLYRDLADEFDELFRVMIQNGVSLELNSGSQRAKESDGRPMGLPDREILLRYKDLGGEMISLGSDAHHKGYVGGFFRETVQWLQELGFRAVVYFEEQKPVYQAI